MSDSDSDFKQILSQIINNLKFIDSNKGKIALKIFEGRYSCNLQYQDDSFGEVVNDAFGHFSEGLYISTVRIELYNNLEFDIIFTVRSKHKYRVDFSEECVLYFDHSFEV